MTDRSPPNDPTSTPPSSSAAEQKATSRRVKSLRDLPLDIAPSRDLWPQIEAHLTATSVKRRPLSPFRAMRAQHLAVAAALVAAIAVGIFIGRGTLPGGREANRTPAASPSQMLPAAFIKDPRYLRERAQLMQSLNARLAALPPQSRQKVLQSLATIHQSMREIQAALGREPGNALLQEMLVDTYQDEMRVLTTVQEAGSGEI
jgi:hypothetical protein